MSSVARRKAPFLKLLILSILVVKNSMHGYAIYKDILLYTKEKWRPSIGTIYRVLNAMNKEGLLVKKKIRLGGRTISQYTITKKGIQVFIEMSRPMLMKMTAILSTFIEAYRRLLKEYDEKLDREVVERLMKLYSSIKEYIEVYKET